MLPDLAADHLGKTIKILSGHIFSRENEAPIKQPSELFPNALLWLSAKSENNLNPSNPFYLLAT